MKSDETEIKMVKMSILLLIILAAYMVNHAMTSNTEESSRSLHSVEKSIQWGIKFLEQGQDDEGSWPYYKSTDPSFATPISEQKIFPTMNILRNMLPIIGTKNRLSQLAKKYLVERMEKDNTWSVDGSYHEYSRDTGLSDFWIVPDTDDTSIGLVVLGDDLRIEGKQVEKIKSLFDRYQDSSGLYLTYLEDYYQDHGYMAGPVNPISLGVNLNIISMFEKYNLDATPVQKAIEKFLLKKEYWTLTEYYKSLAILAYLTSEIIETSKKTRPYLDFLKKFLSDFEAIVISKGYHQLNNMDMASYLKAKFHLCRILKVSCDHLADLALLLMQRQRPDGSWEAGNLYVNKVNSGDLVKYFLPRAQNLLRKKFKSNFTIPTPTPSSAKEWETIYYYGSTYETTSFCLRALWEARNSVSIL